MSTITPNIENHDLGRGKAWTARRVIPFVLLVAVSIAIFLSGWPSTSGRFYLDTEGHFRSIPYFRDPSLSWEKVQNVVLDNPYPSARRPIPNISFMIENRLLGLSPRSGRSINLILHCLNMLLVFFLLRRILELYGLNHGNEDSVGPLDTQPQVPGDLIALAGAVLWGANPFHADSVFYVIQRMTLMATAFYLLATLAYLYARSESRGSAKWWITFAVCALAGLACKENAVLLPLGIAILELGIPKSTSGAVRNRTKLYFGLGVAGLLFIGTFAYLGFNIGSLLQSIQDPKYREFTAGERLLTEGRVLIHYLSLFFLPLASRLTFILKYQLSTSLFVPLTTALSWLLIVTLIGIAIRFLRRQPLIWLAIMWYFANHLLESTVIPLEIAFVHRNYLPSVFLLFPIVFILLQKTKSIKVAGVFLLILIGLFLGGWRTRAQVWGDPAKFWEDAVEKAPGSLRGYINLGVIRDLQNRNEDAIEIYRRGAASAFEETPAAWASLYCCDGIALMNLERYSEAEVMMSKSVALASLPDCFLNLAKLHLRTGNLTEAWNSLNRLERVRPTHQKIHLLRAKILIANGNLRGAQTELMRELAVFPSNTEAGILLKQIQATVLQQ